MPVELANVTVTLVPAVTTHTGLAVVKVAVPATGAGFTVTVTAVAEVTVAHGEFVALT